MQTEWGMSEYTENDHFKMHTNRKPKKKNSWNEKRDRSQPQVD